MSSPLTPALLTELANAGRPLFPGNDVDDQLKRIFRYPLTFPFPSSSLKSRGGTGPAPSVEDITLDLRDHEFEPHVGPRVYLKKKKK